MRLDTTIVAVMAVTPLAGAQVILNQDLSGPVGAGLVPAPWYAWQKTPDTCDASGPFNNTGVPWTPSATGHTFVRAGGDTGINSEAIAQIVTGFTPGATYELKFEQTNLGHQHPTTGDWLGQNGFWDVLIDGVVVGSGSAMIKPTLPTDPIAWSTGAINFVAPAADFELAFRAEATTGAGLAAYLGIDAIEHRLVPAPGAGALLALAGLGTTRRRR